MTPSSFASAAASGTNANSPRTDNSGEWSRRTNGNTQTFRRTSAAVTTSTAQSSSTRDTPAPINRDSTDTTASGVYVPPHRNGTGSDLRYSKEQMLGLFRTMKDLGALNGSVADLAVDGWDKDGANGVPTSPWTRRDDTRDAQAGADVCWDRTGSICPVNLRELTAEDKDLFSSVNSPIKAVQNPTKEATPRESGRKLSLSGAQASPGGLGLTSPSSRPAPRRRETNEQYPFPASGTPSGGIGRRYEPHFPFNQGSSLLRRRTENGRDSEIEDESENASKNEPSNPLPDLKRTITGNTAGAKPFKSSSNSSFGPIGGAFQGFNLPYEGNGASRVGASSQREGLFKNLGRQPMNTATASNVAGLPSLAGLGQSLDADAPQSKSGAIGRGSNEDRMVGSSAIMGTDDNSPPRTRPIGRPASKDNIPSQDSSLQTPHKSGIEQNDTMSPTDTNPYQSPNNNGDEESSTANRPTLAGMRSFMGGDTSNSILTGLGVSDRSQTSSANRPGLGQINALPGLGSNAGWPSSQPTAGTPTRERHATDFRTVFGEGIFSPVEQTVGFSGAYNAGAFSNAGRGGRLPGYIQPTQQDQFPAQQLAGLGLGAESLTDSIQPAFQNLGRNAFNGVGINAPRENVSPFRGARGGFNEASSVGMGSMGDASASPIVPSDHRFGAIASSSQRGQHETGRQSSVNSAGSGQPAPPVRGMCMPDCMRWMYRDSQGNTQGPYSGLEMNDWYKGGFFTPELLIRKAEDNDFEPLAHLIRRIGNSREPFLVPQMGISHPPPQNSSGGWPVPNGAAGVIPPFASSFPIFGTTLSAVAQNSLEERKQAEQLLMVRQKEQLSQRQFGAVPQMHAQYHGERAGFQPPLAHQPSVQSLHSQPSFNNMGAAPGFSHPGIVGQPMSGASGFRQSQHQGPPGSGMNHMNNSHEINMVDDLSRMNLGRGGPSGLEGNHAQQVAMMHKDRAHLQQDQANAHDDEHAAFHNADRLQEFQNLQKQRQAEEELEHSQHGQHASTQSGGLTELERNNIAQSITQQVEAALASKGSQPHVWNRMDHSIAQPIIPPPQSSSPMPAPIAQRKHNAVDTLAAESRSHSQTPSVETPSASIAPWAKEVAEAPKPSLKEIQEAEAKNAAHRDQVAAAARKAALQREIEQQVTVQPEPGLPSTSNWANTQSAAVDHSVGWAKANSGRPAPSTAEKKKTLQQIQKEEEVYKQRLSSSRTQAAAIATTGASQALSSGKRYADLASKAGVPSTPSTSSAWTTVGSSGKVKTPIPTAPAASVRSASGSIAAIGAAPAKPKQAVRSTTLGANRLGQMDAIGHVKSWAVNQLDGQLNNGINAQEFVDSIFTIGLDPEILTDAVHAASTTINSRRFADELIRRRQMADKGIVAQDSTPPLPNPAAASTGGWNEVAKKGPTPGQEPAQSPSNFKVVAPKKKNRKN